MQANLHCSISLNLKFKNPSCCSRPYLLICLIYYLRDRGRPYLCLNLFMKSMYHSQWISSSISSVMDRLGFYHTNEYWVSTSISLSSSKKPNAYEVVGGGGVQECVIGCHPGTCGSILIGKTPLGTAGNDFSSEHLGHPSCTHHEPLTMPREHPQTVVSEYVGFCNCRSHILFPKV